MRYKREQSKTEKNYGVHFYAGKNVICTGKKDKKENMHNSKHGYKY